MEKELLDITEVCKLLGTTSRTLRFYEEKGIITSTKNDFSGRRRYTHAQVQQISNVMVLRKFGFSIKTVAELQSRNCDLKTAVLSRRAEIYASIESRIREINLLDQALGILEAGKDIFDKPITEASVKSGRGYADTVRKCVSLILDCDYKAFSSYCTETLIEYMPESAFLAMWKDTLLPVGDFVCLEKLVEDEKYPNMFYQYIRYEKMGIRIKFVFSDELIGGIWTSYCEL